MQHTNNKKIKLTMTPRGKVHIEMEGFAGEACLQTLGPILKALGNKADLEPTTDYYLPPPSTTLTQDITS